MSTAYVVLAFSCPKSTEKPVFLWASILSESAISVTHSVEILPIDLVSDTGNTFEEAVAAIKEKFATSSSFKWVLNYLKDDCSFVDPPTNIPPAPVAPVAPEVIMSRTDSIDYGQAALDFPHTPAPSKMDSETARVFGPEGWTGPTGPAPTPSSTHVCSTSCRFSGCENPKEISFAPKTDSESSDFDVEHVSDEIAKAIADVVTSVLHSDTTRGLIGKEIFDLLPQSVQKQIPTVSVLCKYLKLHQDDLEIDFVDVKMAKFDKPLGKYIKKWTTAFFSAHEDSEEGEDDQT
jgi:hypothetical protein